MSETNPPSTFSHPQLRPITLICSEGLWLAHPAKGECSAGRGFIPFPLPPVPRSLLDWLVVAGQRFWNRHHRCMAALLLIDCQSGGWTLRLPRQRCGPEFARWSAAAADHPDLPASVRLGGSFQTLAGDDPPDLAVPALPGFHFTLAVTERHPLSAFASRGREPASSRSTTRLARRCWCCRGPGHAAPALITRRRRCLPYRKADCGRSHPGGSRATGVVIDRGYREAQRFIAAACDDPALVARSRQQAEAVLATFFKAMGWDVSVKWKG